MKTLGLTARYLPLPQPISRPTAPSGSELRNRSTIGHGCFAIRCCLSRGEVKNAHLVSRGREMGGYLLIDCVYVPFFVSFPAVLGGSHARRWLMKFSRHENMTWTIPADNINITTLVYACSAVTCQITFMSTCQRRLLQYYINLSKSCEMYVSPYSCIDVVRCKKSKAGREIICMQPSRLTP